MTDSIANAVLRAVAHDSSIEGALRGALLAAPAPMDAPIPTAPPQSDPRFLDALILEYVDGRSWKLAAAFNYHTRVSLLLTVCVPAGFVTDFASIPQIFWTILPPTGMYGKAAVVHDYLYRTYRAASREDADAVFYEAMKALGVGVCKRWFMFRAVRLFGGRAYQGGL